ncbi:hypothetical protein J2T59_002016, partial [Methanosalsum natronophilum]|nr:hypothetical protein [Methanosalsum natronophilum]
NKYTNIESKVAKIIVKSTKLAELANSFSDKNV